MKNYFILITFILITSACSGGGGSDNPANTFTPTVEAVTAGPLDSDYADLAAFVPDGRYASVLKPCAGLDIGDFQESYSCRLSDLPFIGQEVATPDIDDIMSRVVVSHDWMGERFRDALTLSLIHI